jgi:hypothetical protein
VTPGEAYSREQFDLVRSRAKAVEKRDSLILAVVSVGLGAAQLGFIRWAETRLPRGTAASWEVGFFLAYAVLVGWLVQRMLRHRKRNSPRCPQCHQPLAGLSERVAMATGRCDSCGGLVIVD